LEFFIWKEITSLAALGHTKKDICQWFIDDEVNDEKDDKDGLMKYYHSMYIVMDGLR